MNAKGGMAVIVDVQTGDVLAMATVDGATDTAPGAHRAGDRAEPADRPTCTSRARPTR